MLLAGYHTFLPLWIHLLCINYFILRSLIAEHGMYRTSFIRIINKDVQCLLLTGADTLFLLSEPHFFLVCLPCTDYNFIYKMPKQP